MASENKKNKVELTITFLCAVSVAVGFALCLIAENLTHRDSVRKAREVRKTDDRQEY